MAKRRRCFSVDAVMAAVVAGFDEDERSAGGRPVQVDAIFDAPSGQAEGQKDVDLGTRCANGSFT
jgi:hypothetical protein